MQTKNKARIKQEQTKNKPLRNIKKADEILIQTEFNENDVTNDCTECAICIEKFVDKCLICITPCKHIFHYECLSKFIETAKGKQKPTIKCPLCNYDFLEEKNEDKKLNEINNISNHINNIEINNNENNNNENNNIEININENNNNENNNEINNNLNNNENNNN